MHPSSGTPQTSPEDYCSSELARAYDNYYKKRGTWSHKIDFVLSGIGYVIGYTNIWRFPQRAYLLGGGSFVIPCFIMILFVGFPMCFMEIVLGQYTGVGPTNLFHRMAPITSGLGYGMCCYAFLIDIHYIVMLAWVNFYLFAGFANELPWKKCQENAPNCIDYRNSTDNISALPCFPNCVWASDHFFTRSVLGQRQLDQSSWCDYGELNWSLVFCLLMAWTFVGSALIRGIQSSSKVVYCTVPLPLVLLVILGCQSLTLDGAKDGVKYYMTPNVSKLKEPDVWILAATQILYSLGIGFGTLHTLASYNRFDNNCFHDTIWIVMSDIVVSFFAGLVTFSMIGFVSHKTGQKITKVLSEVVSNGPGLIFITMPDAVSRMPLEQFWSFIFFYMCITVGVDSLFGDIESLITAFMDHNEWARPYRSWVIVLLCSMGFLLGISFCAPQGYYLFKLFDEHLSSWNHLLLVFLEVISVAWMYGVNHLWESIAEMNMKINYYVKWYLKLCWVFITPATLAVLFVWHFSYRTVPDEPQTMQEPAIRTLGSIISVTPLIFLPIPVIKRILKAKRKGHHMHLERLFEPTLNWACRNESNLVSTTLSSPKNFIRSYVRRRPWPPPGLQIPPMWDPSVLFRSQPVNQSLPYSSKPPAQAEPSPIHETIAHPESTDTTHKCKRDSEVEVMRRFIH